MRKLGLLLGLAAVACTAYGASPQFTYADIAAGKFAQRTVAGLRSMADGEHYTVLDSGRVVVFSYASGDREGVLASPEDIGAAWQRIADYRLSPAEDKVLFRLDGKPLYRRSAYSSYVVYDTESGEAAPLHESDSLRYAVFSPDGERVAFVLRNNIYVKELATGRETAVTTDGVPNHIINGMPDWVYEEEWGLEDALRWSPDGEKLAFLRFDESGVRDYSLDLYGPDGSTPEDDVTAPRYPRRFTYKYPMAGEANSAVSLHVYDLASGRTTHVDVGPERDQYLPFFGWTPAGALCFYRINRLQNHLEVFVDDLKGTRKMIYEERSDKYIDNIGMGTVTFLSDGDRFIVKNETRTGFSHLYMYSMERGFLYPLTEGEWEVRSLVCATDERVWFLSNETSPLRNNLYVVGTNGKGKRRLTKGEGTYAIAPSEGCKYYISYFSNSSTPNTVTLHDSRGRLLRTLEDNAELKEYIASVGYPVREFFTFPVTHEGRRIELNCYIVKPADFDPGGSYPVLFTQYSGPASQQVLDRWFVDWEDALVQQGYLVVCMDPRGTGGRGE
ncbi:MAG: S9 family peptidase, partial [Alistipes inops]